MAEESSFLNPTRRSYVYESSRGGSGNRNRIILIVAGIIILVALVAFAVIATGGQGENEENLTPTQALPTDSPTPTIEEPTPTEAGTPSPTPRRSPTPGKGTPTPTGTSSVDKASGLDRADLTIIVQNGSGVAGAATKASDLLKDLGYDVVSSGNADNFEYEETEINVRSTKKNFLELLKKDLSGEYTIGSATSTYSGTEADAVVIIGQE